MAVLGSMATIGRNYVLPSVTGMALVYQNRYSRSLVKGLNEQKVSCCFNWITRTYIFMNTSKANIGALFSQKIAHRFSYLGMSSYILMPALYYASKSLEKSDRIYLKRAVDQIFHNIPDLILVATIVQNAAAIYFGISIVQNSILLGFGLLSYLEQGFYITTKREDAGFLHSIFEGKIIRLYNPILQKVNNVSGLGVTFYYGGPFGKIYSVAIAIFNAPKFIKNPIYSIGKSAFCWTVSKIIPGGDQLIKSMTNQYNSVVKKVVHPVFPVPKQISPSWVRSYEKTGITEKNFLTFLTVDQFPAKEDLEELHQTVKNLLFDDRTLSGDDRDKLIQFLGQGNEKGLLRSFISYTKTEKEKEASTIAFKNILGLLSNNWEGAKKLLADRYNDFAHCDIASMRGLIHLQLGLWPEIIKASQESLPEVEAEDNPTDFSKARLDSGVKLVLQQKRDLQFLAFAQKSLMQEIEKRNAYERVLELFIKTVEKARDVEGLSYIKRFGCFVSLKVFKFVYSILNDQKNALLQNEHFINDYKAIFGKTLGLSDYENALRDFNARRALDSQLAKAQSELFRQLGLTDSVLKKEFEEHMQEELIETITNLGDQRLKFNHFRDYVLKRAMETGEELGEEVGNAIAAIPVPNKTTMNELQQQQAFDRAQEMKPQFVKKYLPLVLHDLGFVVKLGVDNTPITVS